MIETRELILSLFNDILASTDATPGLAITDSTVLLESGLDSLGFAILVARLEEELGYDPFTAMAEPVYPTTFGEFVEIYDKAAANR
jgi:hypothetical protein